MCEQRSAEGVGPGDRGQVGLSGVAGGQDDVAGVQGAGLASTAALWRQRSPERDGPFLGGVAPAAGLDGGARPDVELEQLGVRLEEVGQLVLGREDGPPVRER